MIRKLLILGAVILAIVFKENQSETIRYISLAISSACIGSIVQEYIDERK